MPKLERVTSGGSRERVQTPLSDLTLVWNWNSHINIDRIIYHFLTGRFFLTKSALHFATKLNSRDIQKCNLLFLGTLLWYLASAHKAVFPAPTATSFDILGNMWSSLWEVICHKQVQRSFLNQSMDPPPPKQKFLESPTWQGVEPFYSNQASTHQSNHKCKEPSVNKEILASPLNDVQQCWH